MLDSDRLAVRMRPKASGQPCTTRHVFNTYRTVNVTWREGYNESEASVRTTRATRHDMPRATQNDQNGVGSQYTWGGTHRTYVELGVVRFGSVQFGSVQRYPWMLPFHNVGLFSKPNRLGRFGSVRLGSPCSENEA